MAQEPSSRDLLEAVKQQESGGRRYKADGKTLLEGPPTKYGTAKGEMQVLDMTNRDPGFGVRPAKDDSPDERARVGRDYLAAMKKRYGDTETGLIAYNWGPGNTDKWLKKGADPAKLPKETQNYVAKIMASLGGTKVAGTKAAPATAALTKATPTKVAETKVDIPPRRTGAALLQNPLFSQLGPSYQAAMAVSMLADEAEKEDKDEDAPSESEKMLAAMPSTPAPAVELDLGYQSPFPEVQAQAEPAKPGFLPMLRPVRMAEGGEVEDRVEDPQMMANKTTELQGYKTKQPDGTDELWGPDVPVSRSAKELKAYTEALNPAVKTFTGGLGMGTRGYIYPDQPDIINLNTALTPGEREITTLHELEHSMDARGGDIYGRPKFALMGGMDNNYRAYSLMGDDWTPITATVKNMVDNREKLEKFFGRPLDNSYFRKDSYDNLKKVGKTKALFSEQIASLAALEQTTGKFLTQDPEMRELFPSTKMMAVYDALTGPRQTRMDARDLPPHTPVPSYTYEQNPTLRFIKKSLTGENEYGTSYRPFPIKRAGGSPETGEVGYFQDPFGVPDSGPVTSDTLSKGKEFSAADALKALKETGTGVARNVKNIAKGTTETPYNLVGSVADIGNMVLTPLGLGSAEPFLGSAQLKRLATEAGIRPAPPMDPRDAGFYMMGEIASSALNPTSAVRSGVKAATKGKKAAEMLAKDFQAYNQALGPAGVAYAVKPKGGAFTGTREYEYTPSGSIGQETFRDSVTSIIKKGDLMPELRPELKIPIESRNALNSWVEDRIGNYIRRDMATPNDPFVKAVDEGKKLHLLEGLGDIKPMSDLAKRRHKQGFPAWGSAKTPLGRKLEKQIDSSMWSEDIGDVDNYQIYPKMESLKDTNPNMQIYTPGSRIADRMQFPKMIEGMEDMLTERRYTAYGDTSTPIPQEYQLTPEKLQGLSPVDASEKVALFNQWRDKERQVQAAQYLDKYGNVYKKYDNGRKWIAMDDLAVEPKQAELAQQAGCLGGWCTKYTDQAMINGSGDNRLHILFDEKAVPRIQLTVTKSPPQAGDFIAQMDEYQVNNFQNKYGNTRYLIPSQVYDTPEYQAWARTQDIPERITQIKGQFDKIKIADDSNTSRYLKEVQDFVKSKDWATVDNLDGINMIDLDDSLPTISRGLNLEQTNQLSDFMKSLNGGSRFADKYEGKNIVREAAMRVFQPSTPPGRAMGGMVQGYAKGGIADLPKGYDEEDFTTLKPFIPTTTPTANTTGIATLIPNSGNPNAAAAQAASFDAMTPAQKAQHQVVMQAINDAKPLALQLALAVKDAFQNAVSNSTATSSGGVSSTSGSPMGGIASKGTVGQANAAVAAANAALGNAVGGGTSGGGSGGGTSGSGMGGMGTGAAGAAASAAATGVGRADGGMIERQFIDNRRYM